MIGKTIVTWRWAALAVWVVAIAVLMWLVPAPDASKSDLASYLPDYTPSMRGVRAMHEAFPTSSGLSEAVIVFERTDGPLTRADLQAIERVAKKIPQPTTADILAEDLRDVYVHSPASIPLPKNPLISEATDTGQAALVLTHVPANFITLHSARIVDHIRAILATETLPAGLTGEVTGSSGFGRDYALAAERSNKRTLWVTIAAVIVILLLVYRAPLAAMIPLVSISLAAIAALSILALAGRMGFHTGTAERIFVIVLLYGAGTDYSLLFISRCREYLSSGLTPSHAVASGLNATLPATLASAATDAVGLMMLCFSDYGVFRSAGPAIALALGVALVAATTLVPALASIFGSKLFWPDGRVLGKLHSSSRPAGVWASIARLVTRRPGTVFVVTLVVLVVPVVQGARVTWVYDTLAGLGNTYGARRGAEMARRHWPIGEIAPARVLIRRDADCGEAEWRRTADKLTHAIANIDGIRNVRSLTKPLGMHTSATTDTMLKLLGGKIVRKQYISADGTCTRFDVILDEMPLTLEAMAVLAEVRQTVDAELSDLGGGEALFLGATAEITDVRIVTQRDFTRIMALVLGVIFVVIFLLLRDVVLATFMTGCTVLSYLATLGISYWVFPGLFDAAGLDWKVEVFLFVVIAAVGVDYNIFLAARLAEEARRRPPLEAIREAVTHTGPVISSCGIIMAATLGSLMVGDLALLHQLGFSLALGMMIDTFVVRPLLLPAFAALTKRTGGRTALRRKSSPIE